MSVLHPHEQEFGHLTDTLTRGIELEVAQWL
ncbi:MAG: hypothetical protein JWO42_2082 [Chloroflexi bacterium]|nr:hypothetical protein [Chloroflexota bacterium]